MDYVTANFGTGIAGPSYQTQRGATEKDLIELWHIAPLKAMKGDDAFACLTLCFPLIESVIRFELSISDEDSVAFSDNSPALDWFAAFLTIPKAQARVVWDGLRNGLLHRAMLKSEIDYELNGDRPGRPAEFRDGRIYIYVWEVRDRVVAKVQQHGKKLWKGTSSPLPRVYVREA